MVQIDAKGRLFAATAAGYSLPVLDISNPAFAVGPDADEIGRLTETMASQEERRGPLGHFMRRLMVRFFGRKSLLIKAISASGKGYLSSIPTYVLKLGPNNLVPPYDTPIDRAVVGAVPGISLRLRTEQVAGLLAEALVPELAARPAAPLHLINIAGGPAIDSLNVLILLQKQDLLGARQIRIEILDVDPAGPSFGANALTALTATGAPLAGVDVGLKHTPCDWRDLDTIRAALAAIPAEAAVAASSEGGLFDYGSDSEIIDVLGVLRPRALWVAGSATGVDRTSQLLQRANPTRVVMRGAAGMRPLAAAAGYDLAVVAKAPLSEQFLLRRG